MGSTPVMARAVRAARPPRRGALAAASMTALLVASLGAPASMLAAGPVPANDYVTTPEDTPVTANVLANDTDPDGDPLTVISFTPPGSWIGTMDIEANGDLAFTPQPDYSGTTYPTYTVSDGTGTHLAFIVLTVSPVNDPPTAVDDAVDATEDTDLVLAGDTLTGNDTDPEADDLVVSAVADPIGGTVAVAAGSVTFTPAANLCGPGVGGFGYTTDDGNGGTDTASVTVDVTCVNDAPVAVDDSAMVDQASAPALHDVLANDTDAEDDTLSLVSATVDAAAGAASVSTGKVRFAPLASFKGEAVVTYVVSDGDLSDSGTLTVTVGPDVTAPTTALPTVSFGTGRVNESAPLAISWSATDAGTGVASYEVEVSVAGAPFAPLYAGVAKTVTRFYPFRKALEFRVRAIDHEGNTSDWKGSGVRSLAAYQAPGSSAIAYKGTWTSVSTTAASGDRFRYTRTLGGSAKLTFTGRGVLYVAPRTATAGRVRVYLDGVQVARPSLRSATAVPGAIITRKLWGASGSHSIRIVNDTAGSRMNLDVFVVLR